MPQSLIQSSQSGNGIFARLDGSNQPFTGNMGISKASPFFYLSDTTSGTTGGFTHSYAQFADPVGGTAYSLLYYNKLDLFDDSVFTLTRLISDGTKLTIYPDFYGSATNFAVYNEAAELGGSDPGFFISAAGGSAVVRWNKFQFANDGAANSEISGDGYTFFRLTPSSQYDIGYNFNLGGMELVGVDLDTFSIYTKSKTTGTNQGGTILNLSGGVVTGNAESYVTIGATGGGASGTSTDNPNLVATFKYNAIYVPDNIKLILGTGSDCEFYSDGTDIFLTGLVLADVTIQAANASAIDGKILSLVGGTTDDTDTYTHGYVRTGTTQTYTELTIGGVTAIAGDKSNFVVGNNLEVKARAAFRGAVGFRAGATGASAAPFFLTSGALMTTPSVGAYEFLTDKAYITITTGTARKEFVLADGTLTSGRVSFSTTNGRQTDDPDFTFLTDTLTVTKIASTKFTGGLCMAYAAKTTTYTIKTTDYTIDCTSGTFTLTLPTAVGTSGTGEVHVIKNSGTGLITINTTSSQTIDGALTQTLIQYASITVQSNNANWIIISRM